VLGLRSGLGGDGGRRLHVVDYCRLAAAHGGGDERNNKERRKEIEMAMNSDTVMQE
jgi:hypothetical protein